MSAAAGDAGADVTAQVARRWQAIDPLLPVPGTPSPHCGARLAVPGPDGRPVATGTCEHWAAGPGSMDLTWGAARRFRLTPLIAGPDAAAALDALLAQWRGHLAGVPDARGEDTAAVVTWPSRDITGIRTLLRHGCAPLGVIAARAAGRHPAAPADVPDRAAGEAAAPVAAARRGLRIRRAGPADIDAVVRLGLEVIRFDSHFGGVAERPGTAGALRREIAGLLAAAPEAWTWLAERDGNAIGMLCAEKPESAGWIAPMVRPQPVAYLMLMIVLPGERGSGVGAEMVARLHRDVDEAGIPVTLLHYEQTNPLSAPFWGQQGYRPVWTSWEARPARTLR